MEGNEMRLATLAVTGPYRAYATLRLSGDFAFFLF